MLCMLQLPLLLPLQGRLQLLSVPPGRAGCCCAAPLSCTSPSMPCALQLLATAPVAWAPAVPATASWVCGRKEA